MSEQIQRERQNRETLTDIPEDYETKSRTSETEELLSNTDNELAAIDAELEEATLATDALRKLLDDIDAVLEENPEEFVGAYIQKGGQ